MTTQSLKAGDKVVILGRKRTLVRQMPNIAGGWEINKHVDGFRYWNADAMIWRPVSMGLAATGPRQ
jgi:hypothetical protein